MSGEVVATLRRLAEWFDNPNESPPVVVPTPRGEATAGYLLRLIADEMEKAEAFTEEGI